ncbi:hypothetical protein IJ182_04330 [bacterium]|nr:hypothetical protein [bacterium]
MKKILSGILFACFSISVFNPIFASDLSLIKDEQIDYRINTLESGAFNQVKNDEYKFIIKKYIVKNDTPDTYTVIKETDLYNDEDFETFMKLNGFNFFVEDDTFFYTMISIVMPLYVVAAVPLLIRDVSKVPKNRQKNKNRQEEKSKYKQSLIDTQVKPNSESVFFTLQNPKKEMQKYKMMLQNNKTGEIIELIEPDKANFYSVKKYNAKQPQGETPKNLGNNYKTQYFSDDITLSRLEDTLYTYLFSNSAIRLNDDVILIIGGEQKEYHKQVEKNKYVIHREVDNSFAYNLKKNVTYDAAKLQNKRNNPLLFMTSDKNIIVIGGDKSKTLEIYNLKIPVANIESDINNENGFAFEDKDGNIIIGKANNNFIEKYNIKDNKIEKLDGIKTGQVISGEDSSKVYFASYNKLSYLDKYNLKYIEYSNNPNYKANNIIGAYRTKSDKTYIVEKDEYNYVNIYLYGEKDTEKQYIAKNLGEKVQFFKFPYSDNIYFLSGLNKSKIYKIDINQKSADVVLQTDFSLQNGKLPIVSMSDGSLIIAGNCGLYLYIMLEKKH